jgi:hypothetical protein
MTETNRIKKWELNEVTCRLCGDHIGWGEGYPEVWCDQCAKQSEDEDDL